MLNKSLLKKCFSIMVVVFVVGSALATQAQPVSAIDVTVTVDPDQNKIYGETDPVFTYTSSDPEVIFTGALERIAGENVDTYTITQGTLASAGNTINFVSDNFTITTKAASVTPAANTKVYGDIDPALTGTLTGFIPADAVTGNYARVSGETVLGGPYLISATLSPAGVLSNYTITYNTANFTITTKAASVTPAANTKVYGDIDPALTGTLTGFMPADAVTGNYARVSGETVLGGPYLISATLSPAGVLSNYTITYNTANFTITTKAASVTPAANTKVYGDIDPALTGTLTGFMPADAVTGNYARVSGETVLGGPYLISATLSPAGVLSNYTITYNTANFTITTKAASVTPAANTKVYGDIDPALTGTLTGFMPADAVTGNYARVSGETVLGGPYLISATLSPAGVLSNYTITYNTANFTITTKAASVTPAANTKVYGDIDPALTGTLTGFMPADAVTGNYARVSGETVLGGPYLISATLSPAGVLSNYTITYNTANFTITTKAASVTPAANTKVYGDIDPALTGTLTGFMPADAVTGNYARVSGETVLGGPYLISATLSPAGVLSNYTITYNTANFTITTKAASVTPVANTKVYGDIDPALTGTLTGFMPADAVTGNYARVSGETVLGGPYLISATLSPAGVLSNYTITYNTANFTITTKAASVTPAANTKVYGDIDPALTGTLSGFMPADAVTGNYARVSGETVLGGPYLISATLSPAGVLSNYTITYNTANFTILLRPVTVTADNKGKTVGDDDPALTYQITSGSLAFSDVFSGTLIRELGEILGTYDILKGSLALSDNYNLSYTPGTFSIFELTTASITNTYGNAVYLQADFGAPINNKTIDFMLDGVTACSAITDSFGHAICNPTLLADAGDYLTGVRAVFSGDAGYSPSSATARLYVFPRSLTVSGTGVDREYDGTTIAEVTLSDDRPLIEELLDDDLALSYTSATFADANVDSGIEISVSGISIGGADAGNYILVNTTATTTADITAKEITVTADSGQFKLLGQADPVFRYTYVPNDPPILFTGALSRNPGEELGEYDINQGTLSAGSNYAITFFISAKFNIITGYSINLPLIIR